METSQTSSKLSLRLEMVARYLVLAVIFLLPLAVLPGTWLTTPILKMGILATGVLLALILWAAARLNEHKVEFPNTNMLWAALLLVAGYLVAAVLSSNVLHALVGFGFERDTALAIFTFVAAFAAVALMTRKVGDVIRLQQAALASFLILGVLQIARVTFGGDTILPGLFTADATVTTLGSWHDLAVFSGLALLMALTGLALFSSKKLVRGGLYAVMVIAVFLLIIVNLNVAWATIALTTFLLAIYIFSDASYNKETGKFKPKVPWLRLLPSIGILVVSVVFLIAGNTISGRVSDAFNVGYVDVRPSWEGTMIVASGTLQENMFFGVGPNAFKTAWNKYKPLPVNETNFWNTDFNFGIGFIPSAFIAGGLLVGVLWLLFFTAFIHLGVRLFAKRITQPAHMYIAVSSYVGAAYLWVLSVVYVPQTVMLAYAFMLTGAAVAAARIAGVIRTREIQAEKSYTSGLVLTGGLLVVAVVSFGAVVVHAERVTTGAMLSRAVAAANTGNLDRASYIADRTSFFSGDVRPLQLKTNIGVTQLSSILNEKDLDPKTAQARIQQVISYTVSNARAVVDTNPSSYRSWLLLADVYARLAELNVEGAYDSAVSSYEAAGNRNAVNPIIPVSLSRLALVHGELDVARTYAEAALELKSNYTDAHYLLSQIAIQEGNVDEAISATESAVLLQPGNAGLLFQLGVLHYNEGSYERVIPVLERAISINPDYANALYFLGLAYDQVGNQEGALATFERVAALNPDNAEVQEIVTALTEGRSASTVLGGDVPSVNGLGELPVSEGR